MTQASLSGLRPIRQLLVRGSVYSIATALQAIGAVLVLPLATRLLSPDELGVVVVAFGLQMIVAAIGGAGLPEVLPQVFFKTVDGPIRARALAAVAALLSLTVAAFAILTIPIWAPPLGMDDDPALAIGLATAPATAVVMVALALLRARDQPFPFVALSLTSTVGGQIVGIAFVAATGGGAAAYLLGPLVCTAISAMAGIALVRPDLAAARDRSIVAAGLRLSIPTVAHTLGFYVIWGGDRVVIQALQGSAAVGRYHVAYLVGAFAIAAVSAIYNAWSPIVFAARPDRRWVTLAETAAVVYRVTALLAAATALAAPALLRVFAPTRYDPVQLSRLSAVIALAAVPFVTYCANVQILLWRGRTGVIARVTPLVAAFNIAVTVALVSAIGIAGAAVATTASYIAQSALVARAARREVTVAWDRRATVDAYALTSLAVVASIALPAAGAWAYIRVGATAAVMLRLAYVARAAIRQS